MNRAYATVVMPNLTKLWPYWTMSECYVIITGLSNMSECCLYGRTKHVSTCYNFKISKDKNTVCLIHHSLFGGYMFWPFEGSSSGLLLGSSVSTVGIPTCTQHSHLNNTSGWLQPKKNLKYQLKNMHTINVPSLLVSQFLSASHHSTITPYRRPGSTSAHLQSLHLELIISISIWVVAKEGSQV